MTTVPMISTPASADTLDRETWEQQELEKLHQRARRALRALRECAYTTEKAYEPEEATTLLKHLRPGQPEVAAWCHAALAREVTDHLRRSGFVDEWAPILGTVCSYLWGCHWEYQGSRWAPRK